MKVAIMSFPGSPSHGASLQMYALYYTIKKMDHTPIILYYIPKALEQQYLGNNGRNKTIKSRAVNAISRLFLPSSKDAFSSFEAKFQKIPEEILTDKKELPIVTAGCDRIIVGSDQVWNMDITYHDFSFFLDFCHDRYKKASYAPSFGNDTVYENERETISNLLKEFSFLSAREKRGCEIIKELTGKEVPMVCDPTFLVSGEEWRRIAKEPKYKMPYVLFYTIKPSQSLYQKAEKFANTHHMELVTIGGRLRDYFDPKRNPVFGVGPLEFLGLIDNASYVFTNSFHGTALSIILQKNFYVEYSSNTNTRLINLIEMTELEKRVVNVDTDLNNEVHIEYEQVQKKLQPLIKESLSYLEGILKQ